MLHVKFISNLLGKIWLALAPELNHSHSPLPLPPLNFPLTILFKIHGLSYLFFFFFENDNCNSPEPAKGA